MAIVDLFARNVLNWKLSNSLNVVVPRSHGNDAGRWSQARDLPLQSELPIHLFKFVARLQAEKIKISWSARKRCYYNILVERLWQTGKYEVLYLHA